MLVDHLHDPDDVPPDEDGHAQDRLGDVTGQLIDGAVEAGVGVRVGDVQDLPRLRHDARDALADGESGGEGEDG